MLSRMVYSARCTAQSHTSWQCRADICKVRGVRTPSPVLVWLYDILFGYVFECLREL